MARAKFLRDFDWPVPGTRRFLACKAGKTYSELKRGLVDDAVAAGAAEELRALSRSARKPRAPKA